MSSIEPMTATLVNPATAEPITTVASASVDDTDAAIERAATAFPAWRDLAPGERARLLRRFAAGVEDHLGELAGLEVTNSGHPVGNARWEAGNVRDVLNYYSAAPESLSVNSHSSVRYWTPFGDFKQSGLGRELGPDAPNAFTEEKNVLFSQE